MLSIEQLQVITKFLSQEPFKKSISVYELHDTCTFEELFVFVIQVCSYIDRDHPVPHLSMSSLDIARDGIEEMGFVIVRAFLSMLRYIYISEFENCIQSKNRVALLNVLLFLIENKEKNEKRAYLAVYLGNLDVPDEFMQHEDIVNAFNQLKALQNDFKEIHKQVESHRLDGKMINGMKKSISDMEEERKQIIIKIDRLNRNVESVKNSKSWLEAADSMRIELNRKAELLFRIKEQTEYAEAAERKLAIVQERLNVLQISNHESPEQVAEKLQKELERQENQIQAFYPQEKLRMKMELEWMNQLLQRPTIGESDIQSLREEVHQFEDEVIVIRQKVSEVESSQAKQNLENFKKQQLNMAEKKKSVEQKLAQSKQAHEDAMAEQDRRKRLSEMLRGDTIKSFLSTVKDISNDYKQKKQHLGNLTMAYEQLQNEYLQLREKQQQQQSDLQRGDSNNIYNLQKQLNSMNESIQNGKAKLAPLLQKVKDARKECQELESQVHQKQRELDTIRASTDGEAIRLDIEWKQLKEQLTSLQQEERKMDIAVQKLKQRRERLLKDQTSTDPSKKSYKEELERDLKASQHTMSALMQMEKMLQVKEEKSKKTLEVLSFMERLLHFKTTYYENRVYSNNSLYQYNSSSEILSVVSFYSAG